MTPNEHDISETSEERELTTTELYPFVTGYPPGTRREIDDTLPDVPAMEQLPDLDALPDPGYPEMPATARGYATGIVEPLPADWQVDEPPAARSDTSAWAPAPWRPSFDQVEQEPPSAAPSAAAETPKQVWSPDPYAAPRAPDDAPPLRGPSVPWSEVRAAADHEAGGEPLEAPPTLRPNPAEAGPAVATPPEEFVQRSTADALTSDLLLPGKRATPDGGWRRTVYRAT